LNSKRQKGAQPKNKNAKKEPKELGIRRVFRATDEEYNIIKENAKKAEMTVSAFIRHRTMSK
jgi:hypothetical protein